MAFDASDYFRKHKRVVFAVLTLIALFTFIVGDALTGRMAGGGGPSRRNRSWFQGSGEPVATVGGESYDEQKLEELGARRFAALNYLYSLYEQGQMLGYMAAGFSQQEAAVLPTLIRYEQELAQRGQRLENDPRVPAPAKEVFKRFQEMQSSDTSRERLRAAFQPKKQSLALGLLQSMPQESLAPLRLVDFLYWKKRADELGVVMPNAVVLDDLKNLALNKLEDADLQNLRVRNRQTGQMQMEELLSFVGDELKAMIARDLVQGGRQFSLSGSGEPLAKLAQTTPLDLWDGYVALKTQLDVAILPLSVSNKEFIEKVKEPSKADLRAYFDKYKDKLPSKEADTPGFRIPKQYKVELLHANLRVAQPARKHYEKWVEVFDAINPAGAFIATFGEYQKRQNEFRLFELTEDYPIGAGADRKFVRLGSWGALREDPQLAAQVAGALAAGAALAPQSLFSGGLVLQPGFRPVTAKEEKLLEAAQALGRAAAGAFNWAGLAGDAPKVRRLTKERFRPFDEVANILQYDRVEEQCRSLLQGDLAKLGKELMDYGKKYSEARAKWRAGRRPGGPAFTPPLFDDAKKLSVEDHIRQFAAARGLTYAGMKQARPADELFDERGDDNALSTYLMPIFKTIPLAISDEELKRQIAPGLTDDRLRVYEWRERRPFDPKWFELAFTWKAEQTEERTPTYEEAEAAVRIAWMREQARPFAEQAAEALAQEVKKQPDGIRLLMDKPGYKGHETVARYRLALNQAAATSVAYEPCPVPVIENPPADFVDQALGKLQSPGDYMILWNQPKTTCYLVMLRGREEPKAADAKAREDFDFKIMSPGLGRQPLVSRSPFGSFVQEEKIRKAQADWFAFLKAHTKFNDKLAEQVANQLRSATRS